MYPVICEIGNLTIYSYGMMFAIACLVFLMLTLAEGKRLKIDPNVFYDLFFWTLIGAIIGARLLYVATNFQNYAHNLREILNIHHGGQSWFGGFIFGLLSFYLVSRKKGISFLRLADITVPYLALAHALGRIGCFLNGCCYGAPTNFFLAVQFPRFALRVHPTQMYASFGLLMIFAILLTIRRRVKNIRSGMILCLYLFLYGLNRFLMEFLRADIIPTHLFNLTLYQVFSLGLILTSIIIFVVLKLKKK